jgi:hypothetical protein
MMTEKFSNKGKKPLLLKSIKPTESDPIEGSFSTNDKC